MMLDQHAKGTGSFSRSIMCDLCVEKIIIKDGYVAIPPPRRNENKRENDVQENL